MVMVQVPGPGSGNRTSGCQLVWNRVVLRPVSSVTTTARVTSVVAGAGSRVMKMPLLSIPIAELRGSPALAGRASGSVIVIAV